MQTLYKPIAFSPVARLSQSIGDSDAVIPVDNIQAFPDAPSLATIGVDENAETILYAAKTENSLSGCTRGVEGTAKRWQAGEAIGRNFTAKDHADIIANLQEVNQTASSKLSAPEIATDGQVLTYRTGEWKAETLPESGVSSFNGRTGAIVPQDGDYTATQVGARPNNWTPTAEEVGAISKVTGAQGQFLGFTAENVVGAVDAPKGGGSGKRYARFVVGTSTAGWTLADCDYLCDGADDQVEINAAIQALPAGGGEVVVLDGTYNITANIEVNKANTKLSGNGTATVLKAMASSIKIINITVNYCAVTFLMCDGNKTSYSNNYGIYLSGDNNTVTGNTCNNNYGIYITSGDNNTVTGNTCNNSDNGITISTSSNNTITENTCNNSKTNGIYNSGGSNNTITGNNCSNSDYGIYNNGSNNTITGNNCSNSDHGIYNNGSNNTITGNNCVRGTGTSGDYVGTQYAIKDTGENNLIVGNNCMGKAPLDGGTNNTITNNKY